MFLFFFFFLHPVEPKHLIAPLVAPHAAQCTIVKARGWKSEIKNDRQKQRKGPVRPLTTVGLYSGELQARAATTSQFLNMISILYVSNYYDTALSKSVIGFSGIKRQDQEYQTHT